MASLQEKLKSFMDLFGSGPEATAAAQAIIEQAAQAEKEAIAIGLSHKAEGDESAAVAPEATADEGDDDPMLVMDMTAADFEEMLTKALTAAMGGMATKAELNEVRTSAASVKDSSGDVDALRQQIKAIQDDIASKLANLDKLQETVKELSSDQPRIVANSRASTSNKTIIELPDGFGSGPQGDEYDKAAAEIAARFGGQQ